jgi:hypothetical protein
MPPCTASRPRLLIVGCGDVGLRVLRLLRPRWRVLALSSSPARCPNCAPPAPCRCSATWTTPPRSAAWAAWPTPCCTWRRRRCRACTDPRTRHLVQALARGGRVRRLVYASTTGVYGDCGGARFDETRAVAPATDRARRRVDAEATLRWYGRRSGRR